MPEATLTSNTESIDLDALLDPPQCAGWMRIEERTLLENARKGRIPVIRINKRVLRFHPRSIIEARQKGGAR
jgi:hypothetical protein